jgi:HPt (histidine-containing phosphotransfer) domain-containing protein
VSININTENNLTDSVFARLQDIVGDDPDSFKLILNCFTEDAAHQLESLGAAVIAHDFVNVKLIAHNIKGMSANVGLVPLQQKALEMEHLALDHADMTPVLNEMLDLYQTFEEQLTARLA